jgi:hypothetical protein
MYSKHTWLPNGNEKLDKIQTIKINLRIRIKLSKYKRKITKKIHTKYPRRNDTPF